MLEEINKDYTGFLQGKALENREKPILSGGYWTWMGHGVDRWCLMWNILVYLICYCTYISRMGLWAPLFFKEVECSFSPLLSHKYHWISLTLKTNLTMCWFAGGSGVKEVYIYIYWHLLALDDIKQINRGQHHSTAREISAWCFVNHILKPTCRWRVFDIISVITEKKIILYSRSQNTYMTGILLPHPSPAFYTMKWNPSSKNSISGAWFITCP